MEYRQLGNTGLSLSAIAFGAWAIGKWEQGGVEPADATAALRKAYEMGFTSIDTAPLYGLGLSEEIVATAFAGIPRDRLQLMTKCGVVWGEARGHLWVKDKKLQDGVINIYKYGGKESIIQQCEDSLRRLGTDYIDLYSLHWPDPTTPVEESMEALVRLKEQGKIRLAGVCNHTMEQMAQADGAIDVAFNKVRYSMLNRKIEEDLIPYCREEKKSILAYSVLQRGILTGRDLPQFLWRVGDTPWEVALYKQENMVRIKAFLDQLTPIARDYGGTVTHLCIRWAMEQPGITTVLLGATSAEQIVYDARAMDMTLSAADMNTVDLLLANLEKDLDLN
ncbi:aldo/keto reductase [Flavitalea sp. BT771]|uniref:aldo/keto reductase n=1 Tax=Flavitalea sp. BT771 TaxID=3063329 RepID=UPI0026E2734E|nr:aldo/keto reductase [Flavitalea sp. BT771]MDO6431643.1 aldo/keto reductase [Flavitalea sp. BT771]MDV6220551.1 aldo/keto reductase [Flavitalea sp. BT771]